jgi:hypothetical protein
MKWVPLPLERGHKGWEPVTLLLCRAYNHLEEILASPCLEETSDSCVVKESTLRGVSP